MAQDPRGILANAACPGWVKTRMGGAGAPRTVQQGADTPLWLALLPEGGTGAAVAPVGVSAEAARSWCLHGHGPRRRHRRA